MNLSTYKVNGKKFQVYIRDQADESVAAEIFKLNEYRSAESIIKRAKHSIVDIGAHGGYFCLYVRSLNPEVKIVAVEPEPHNIKFLQKNLELNNIKNVQIIEAAIAETSGRRSLVISPDSHNHYLAPANSKKVKDKVVVDTFSLSVLAKRCILMDIDLLKMDIEGGEHEIFDSISGETLRLMHALIMEYHQVAGRNFSKIETKLREGGFSVSIFPSHFDKKMGFIFALQK